MIRFNASYLYVFVLMIAGFDRVRLCRFLLSGNSMPKIKDYFFLEKTNVINYGHSDEE